MDRCIQQQAIRAQFAVYAIAGVAFIDCILALAPSMKDFAIDANNWDLLYDLLHWEWEGYGREPIAIEERERISLIFAPCPEAQEKLIERAKRDAQEWAEALMESGLSPMEAIGLATEASQQIVAAEVVQSQIVSHPSAIAIPQTLMELQCNFYRPASRDRTNVLKPLMTATKVIRKSRSEGTDLAMEVAGALTAQMRQIRAGTAKGRWVAKGLSEDILQVSRYADFLVHKVLSERFGGDKAQFSSKTGIGLIEDAVFYLYLLKADNEKQTRKPKED